MKQIPIRIDNQLNDSIEKYIERIGAVSKQDVYRKLLRDGLKYNLGNDKDLERAMLEVATKNSLHSRLLIEHVLNMVFDNSKSKHEHAKEHILAMDDVVKKNMDTLVETRKKVITGE